MRYEFIGGTSRKFWEIEPPYVVPARIGTGAPEWVVTVQYGRIGTAGVSHMKVFSHQYAASDYYRSKIQEKLNKGYTLVGIAPLNRTVARIQTRVVKPAAVCDHPTLDNMGNGKWRCTACKAQVEFDSPTPGSAIQIEPERVRRFINLRRPA